jgi:hypothetical protein
MENQPQKTTLQTRSQTFHIKTIHSLLFIFQKEIAVFASNIEINVL